MVEDKKNSGITHPGMRIVATNHTTSMDEITGKKKELVGGILNTTEPIDFFKLATSNNGDDIVRMLESKNDTEQVFSVFFDFLRQEFFQKNLPLPSIFFQIIRTNTSVKDWINVYIGRKNSQLLSSQNVEQHEVVSFYLFLLGMKPDFDIIEDIQFNSFARLKDLFSQYTLDIGKIIGKIDSPRMEDEKDLNQKLDSYKTLCETINKLALIYSINFEGRGISFELSSIVESNITSIIVTLKNNFPDNEEILGLCDILGKSKLNFAHGLPIEGSTREEIRASINRIKNIQQKGYKIQASANIVPRALLDIVMLGNETFVELVGLEKIENIYGTLNEREREEKQKLISHLVDIYNYGKVKSFQSSEQAIQDFIDGGYIKDEYQIETIHHLVLFDTNISDVTMLKLLSFLIKGNNENNFFYEEFRIKILERIMKYASANPSLYKKHSEELFSYLETKNISHAVLSYSKVYLALALYYIDIDSCTDTDLNSAQVNFVHYTNLKTKKNSHELEEMENHFYEKLFKRKNSKIFGRDYNISPEDMRRGGELIFGEFLEKYQNASIVTIEREIGDMRNFLNTNNEIFSANQINLILGNIIEKEIFYNLCKITITGDCRNCEIRKMQGASCIRDKTTPSRTRGKCEPEVGRGFEEEEIELTGGVNIRFVYPIISKQIFYQIFKQRQNLIRERLGGIIATNAKNADIMQFSHEITLQNEKLKKLAFYDSETGLPNVNKLSDDLSHGEEKTLALIEVADYINLIECQGGVEAWLDISRQIAKYLSQISGCSAYQYDKMTFCIVCSPEKAQKMIGEIREETINTAHIMLENLFAKINIELHQSFQFHVGLVIGEKIHHIKHAHIALKKAKHYRANPIYTFQEGDEKVPEETQYNSRLFTAALDRSDKSVNIIPHYQYIHNPKNIEAKRVEALARIEQIFPDGKTELFGPNIFLNIATAKKRLSDITLAMLPQILLDMEQDPSLIVSINFHEQDWNDNGGVMAAFCSMKDYNETLMNRIYIEVLETVPFDRAEDIQKIQELKSFGFKISIDDYGTNRGNLKKLILVDPDNIKIDGDIVKQLLNPNTVDLATVAICSVVYHAKLITDIRRKQSGYKENDRVTVTAECVETKEIFHMLRDMGVDLFQGYYFAKPAAFYELGELGKGKI